MSLSGISKKLRQFPVLIVCAVLVILSGVLFFMRGPKVQLLQAQLTDLEREWGNIQTNVERSVGLEADGTALQDGLSNIRARLVNVDEVASNYEFFYDLERRSGVKYLQFSQGQASNGATLPIGRDGLKHFQVVPYDITMTGTLTTILDLLDLLDRQTFIVRTDLLNVAPASVKDGIGSEQLNARLRCHVLASLNE